MVGTELAELEPITRLCLNPFEIRAWLAPMWDAKAQQTRDGLNPFEIRAWLAPDARRCGLRELGLNPFEIRAWLAHDSHAPRTGCQRLNPFEIRAWLARDVPIHSKRVTMS